LVDDTGTAYIQYYDLDWAQQLSAIDVRTWTTKWTRETSATPVIAVDNGDVVVNDPDTQSVIEIDPHGATVGTTPLQSQLSSPTVILHNQGILHGVDDSGNVIETQMSVVRETPSSFAPLRSQVGNVGCVPPNFNHIFGRGKNLAAGSINLYLAINNLSQPWTPDQRSAMDLGFLKWTQANVLSGLGTSFDPAPETDVTHTITTGKLDLGVVVDSTGRRRFKAGQTAPTVAADGTITGASIYYTTVPGILPNPNSYLRVTLHEVGHTLGFDDANGTNGTTVMNQLDIQENVPLDVTACDRTQALRAPTRSWP
jgi:hypothetical protein